MAIFERLGHSMNAGSTLGVLAELRAHSGHYTQARKYARDALDVYRRIDNQQLIAEELCRLGSRCYRFPSESTHNSFKPCVPVCRPRNTRPHGTPAISSTSRRHSKKLRACTCDVLRGSKALQARRPYAINGTIGGEAWQGTSGRRSMISRPMLPFVLLLTLMLLSTETVRANTVTLTLDPAQSTVNWKLGAFLHTVDGTFTLQRGTISFDPSEGEKAAGDVLIDLTSGRSGNPARDRHMQNDVLQTQAYPSAVFTADRVAGHFVSTGTSELDVHGVLLIHGGRHEMTLHVAVAPKAGQLTAHTQFTVPYVAWGMKDPSTFILRVNDHVDIDITAAVALSSAPVQ